MTRRPAAAAVLLPQPPGHLLHQAQPARGEATAVALACSAGFVAKTPPLPLRVPPASQEAFHQFDTAVSLAPEEATLYYNRGRQHLVLGRLKEAEVGQDALPHFTAFALCFHCLCLVFPLPLPSVSTASPCVLHLLKHRAFLLPPKGLHFHCLSPPFLVLPPSKAGALLPFKHSETLHVAAFPRASTL